MQTINISSNISLYSNSCWITYKGLFYTISNYLRIKDLTDRELKYYEDDINPQQFLLDMSLKNNIINELFYFNTKCQRHDDEIKVYDEVTKTFISTDRNINGKLLSDHHLMEFRHRDTINLYNIMTWNLLHHLTYYGILLNLGLISEDESKKLVKCKNDKYAKYDLFDIDNNKIHENFLEAEHISIERYNKILEIIINLYINDDFDIICLQECEDYILKKLNNYISNNNLNWIIKYSDCHDSNLSKRMNLTWKRVIIFNNNKMNLSDNELNNLYIIDRCYGIKTQNDFIGSCHYDRKSLMSYLFNVIYENYDKENIILIGDFNTKMDKIEKTFQNMNKLYNDKPIIQSNEVTLIHEVLKTLTDENIINDILNDNDVDIVYDNDLPTFRFNDNSENEEDIDEIIYYYKIYTDTYIDGYIHLSKKYLDGYNKLHIDTSIKDKIERYYFFAKCIVKTANNINYEKKLKEKKNKNKNEIKNEIKNNILNNIIKKINTLIAINNTNKNAL